MKTPALVLAVLILIPASLLFATDEIPKPTPALAALKLQEPNRIEDPLKHAPAPVQLVSDAIRQANAKLDSGDVAGALADYREIFRNFEPSSESFLACYSAYQAAAKLEEKKELAAAKSSCDAGSGMRISGLPGAANAG